MVRLSALASMMFRSGLSFDISFAAMSMQVIFKLGYSRLKKSMKNPLPQPTSSIVDDLFKAIGYDFIDASMLF